MKETSQPALRPTSREHAVERVYELIRARGGRVTRPRTLILQALLATTGHVNGLQLYERVQAADPLVNEATIYRTLSALEELGVVYHVHLGHGPAVWHLAEDEHQHLVCLRCNQVTHVAAREFKPLERRIEKRYGFKLRPHFAEVGICAECTTTTEALTVTG